MVFSKRHSLISNILSAGIGLFVLLPGLPMQVVDQPYQQALSEQAHIYANPTIFYVPHLHPFVQFRESFKEPQGFQMMQFQTDGAKRHRSTR